MKKIILILICLGAFSAQLSAQQGSGSFKGTVTDKEKKEAIPFANVILEMNGTLVAGSVTDFDGNFNIKPVAPGKYNVKVSCVGYTTMELHGVIVSSDKITVQDVALGSAAQQLGPAIVVQIAGPPLIDPGDTKSSQTMTREDIKNATSRDVRTVAATTAGVNQRDDGQALNIKGQRSDATVYYIDGVPVRGSISVPNQGIEQITVITGGVPASYGDATGGIITMTTRGPSRNFFGAIEAITSQGLDPFGYNLVSGSLSGPLKTAYDTSLKASRSILGFFMAGEFIHQKDPDPSAIGLWKVKDEKMAWLEKNPLRLSPTGSGYVYNTEFVTMNDLEPIKVKQNASNYAINYNGKIDFQPKLNTNFVLGGGYNYSNGHSYVRDYSIFNPTNNPQSINSSYRVFGRFTQKFNQTQERDKEKSAKNSGGLKNAYYSIQVNYENVKGKTQDDSHKDRLFEYGYIGKFNTYQMPFYSYGTDTIDGQIRSGWLLRGFTDTAMTFDPTSATYNPIAAEYTNQAYALNPGGFRNETDLLDVRGIPNGYRADNVYALWFNTGREYNGYSYSEAEQFRVTAMASADLGKHAIILGMEYEQRTDRSYSTGPVGLWRLMKQLGNLKNEQLDLEHPIMSADFVEGDTINYTLRYDDDGKTGFFENVRKKFNVPNNEWIDIDSYSPEEFSLDMFTAQELLDNGIVGYYGYDYLGKKQKKKPSFDDFFTKKDDLGNFTRDIPAFQPIYIAGYIQDVFQFKDLTFNLGLRVDRYDANQKVLKDKYLLYAAKTVGEVDGVMNPIGKHPGSIAEDAVVYVNDKNFPTQIVGYREGDKWFDYSGVALDNPATIGKLSSSGSVTPFLVDPSQENVSADVFEDYKPQTTFMPRISFSFPISDQALFFAHYDVLTQRPTTANRMNPLSFYYMEQTVDPNLPNPDLKPARTTDYELGFKQALSKNTALKISGFYRELRNMIQITNVIGAYPKNYTHYGNIDFGTVKGLTLEYDLRRIGNARATANYTLQFADGTGSGASTNVNMIGNGKPNLRIPVPLDFDQRHVFAVVFDYRFGSGKGDDVYNGPKAGGKNILARTGANLMLNAGSGYPYSRQANITQDGATGLALNRNLSGSINGSRLPWQYRLNLKIDREIPLVLGQNAEKKKNINMRVYIWVQNLLNTKNIMAVYRATGNPGDDGYLAASSSQTAIDNQTNEQAFRDMYAIRINNPDNYSLPRRIRLGVELNF